MALKDITLGQYFPGHSLIHRFDPRGKIIFTVIYIVAIFLCNALVSYGLALVVLLILIAISRVPSNFPKGNEARHLPCDLTALLNLFYTSEDRALELWHPHHHGRGHLAGRFHGAADLHAHRLHPPADLHHLPHYSSPTAWNGCCVP